MSTNPLKSGLVALSAIGLAAFNLAAVSTDASAQERVRWKMPSAFASSLTHLGPSGVRFSKDVERLSGGKFEMKFFDRAGPGMLRRRIQRFGGIVLDDAGLSHG
jgi:TRAP-type mannitol/chloroaromatic compound transport system substrate-binding protein